MGDLSFGILWGEGQCGLRAGEREKEKEIDYENENENENEEDNEEKNGHERVREPLREYEKAVGGCMGGLSDLTYEAVNDPSPHSTQASRSEQPDRGSPGSAGPLWLPRNPVLRRATLMLMDGVLLAAALALNFEIWLRFRFEGQVPPEYLTLFVHVFVPIVGMRLALFQAFGLYRSMGRHVGFYELRLIATAGTLATALIIVLNFGTGAIERLGSFPLNAGGEHLLRIPWGIVFNDWMLTLILVAGVRLARREIEIGVLRFGPGEARRVLICGAGDTGEQVARDLARTTQGNYRPVAYVDPDPALTGLKIHGLPVAGTLAELPKIIERYHPHEIVIALQAPSPRVLTEILGHCRAARMEFRIVPALPSVMSGRIEVSTLRPVEIEDLLGREPIDLNDESRPTYLGGKRVMITGGGGSIGRELCRQALGQQPKTIMLLGRGENSLFEANVDLAPVAEEAGVELSIVIANVCDEPAIDRIFEAFRPEVVFHAAAHKHVHFMEAQPAEAVKNNVWGTLVVARAAARIGLQHFIFISTDKAVRPNGAMGASKRVAEMIVSAFNERSAGSFVSVRFGNVLGSRGSVIPTFRRQIEQGGPVTVTDPEVTRYFMTTAEAVSLVIQAGAQGEGGELFVLDMGRPIKIADLARNLITLSGLEPERDIPIVFTGMRPGEKMTEELLTQDEGVHATENGKIFITRNEARPWGELEPVVMELIAAAERDDRGAMRETLERLIEDYHPMVESGGPDGS